MSQFENDPKTGTKIPDELLAIIKKIIVGKNTAIYPTVVTCTH
jgi:hypothetical protein